MTVTSAMVAPSAEQVAELAQALRESAARLQELREDIEVARRERNRLLMLAGVRVLGRVPRARLQEWSGLSSAQLSRVIEEERRRALNRWLLNHSPGPPPRRRRRWSTRV